MQLQKISVADPWNFGTDPDADPDSRPYLRLMDPNPDADPAIFVINLEDVKKSNFFAYFYLTVHWDNSLKIKSHKEVTKQ
jgi:hypothetical protein